MHARNRHRAVCAPTASMLSPSRGTVSGRPAKQPNRRNQELRRGSQACTAGAAGSLTRNRVVQRELEHHLLPPLLRLADVGQRHRKAGAPAYPEDQ